MIYAELQVDGGYEKGIFLTLAEFVEYRKQGWSGCKEVNAMADAVIELEQERSKND